MNTIVVEVEFDIFHKHALSLLLVWLVGWKLVKLVNLQLGSDVTRKTPFSYFFEKCRLIQQDFMKFLLEKTRVGKDLYLVCKLLQVLSRDP